MQLRKFLPPGEQFNSPGITKLSKGVSSEMTALGSTKAPVDISGISGLAGEDGLDASTTLAKCVGTETLGGEPIISCVCAKKYFGEMKMKVK